MILPQMAELGLLGCSVPVEYGGAGMDYVSLGLILTRNSSTWIHRSASSCRSTPA